MKNLIQTLKSHPYYTVSAVLGLILVIVFVLSPNDQEQPEETSKETRSVNTISVSEHSQGALGVAVPTAQGNSFVIRAESSGRVEETAKVGATVQKGTILARLDNAAQLAALTQAEGNYEAAVASAEQSGFSIESGQETLTSSYSTANTTLRSTGISVHGILENTINNYFSDGLRQSLQLDDYFWEKKLLDYALTDWTELTKTTVSNNQIIAQLDAQISVTERVAELLDVIFEKVIDNENGATTAERVILNSYKTALTTAKTTVASNLQSLKDTKLDVTDAEASLKRAESSSLGGATSAEEAYIKQALGSLQSAQSSYAKTIVRAPFAGTISSLNIAVGDIINVGTDVAIIVPEAGEETTKSFNLPLSAIKYTPDNSYVFTVDETGTLESVSIETGLVTANYINVTGLNGDEVIVNDVRGLKAGQRVNVLN